MEGKLNRPPAYTNIIVHICGSCKISIPSLYNIVVFDDFDLQFF